MNYETVSARGALALTDDQIRQVAPSVYAANPWHAVSARYRHIGTSAVLDMLRDQGFLPVWAAQSKTRIPGKQDFTHHMLRMRHAEYLGAMGIDVPELVMVNSHDRSSSYKFLCGVFRTVCGNRMIAMSDDFGSFSVNHCGSGDFGRHVMDASFKIIEHAPRVIAQVAEWKQISLEPVAQQIFAETVREYLGTPNVRPTQLLDSRRPEDAPDAQGNRTLWTTFNAVQENVTKGGVRGVTPKGRRSTTRPIKAVTRDITVNKALWSMAEKMAQLVK